MKEPSSVRSLREELAAQARRAAPAKHAVTVKVEYLDGARFFLAACSCGWQAPTLEPGLLDAYAAQEYHARLGGRAEDPDFPGATT